MGKKNTEGILSLKSPRLWQAIVNFHLAHANSKINNLAGSSKRRLAKICAAPVFLFFAFITIFGLSNRFAYTAYAEDYKTIIYYYNSDGTGARFEEEVPSGDNVYLRSYSSMFTLPAGKEFGGWSKQKNGGLVFSDGAYARDFQIDAITRLYPIYTTVEVIAPQPTLTVNSPIVYDGAPVTCGQGGADITYSYEGGGDVEIKFYAGGAERGEEIIAPTNSGSYWVGASAGAEEVFAAFEILKADVTAAMFSCDLSDLTYDWQEKAVSVTHGKGASIGALTVLYNGSPEAPINAGSYQIKVSAQAGTNYNAANNIILGTLTVQKAEAVIGIISFPEKTYDGNAVSAENLSYQYTGDGAVSVKFYLGGEETAAPADAGSYEIGISAIEGDNYNAAAETRESFAISKATVTADLFLYDLSDLTYDEQKKAVSVTHGKGASIGALTVLYNGSPEAPINAGSYQIKVSAQAGTNYDAATDIILGTLTVLKAEAVLRNLSFPDKVYDGSAVSATALSYEFRGEGLVVIKFYADISGVELTLLENAPRNVGSYAIGVSAVESVNYCATEEQYVRFSVTKMRVRAPEITGKTYTGQSLSPDWEPNPLYELCESEQIGAGTYEIIFRLTDSANCCWESDKSEASPETTLSFVISKAQNEWESALGSVSSVYGEKLSAPDASAKFGTPIFKYYSDAACILEIALPSEIGEYFVKAIVAATDDYYGLESEAAAFSIIPDPDGYTLTVYFDKDGEVSSLRYTHLYGEEYSYPVPQIDGYSADMETISGVGDACDCETTVFYTVRSYLFTIEFGNGQANSQTLVPYNGALVLPEAPAYAGYQFEGWEWGDGGALTAMPAGNVTISAKWSAMSLSSAEQSGANLTAAQAELSDVPAPELSKAAVVTASVGSAAVIIGLVLGLPLSLRFRAKKRAASSKAAPRKKKV